MKNYEQDEIQAIIDHIEQGNFLDLPDIEGYSSKKVRNLLNRLVGMRQNTTYLEIGVHLGSTFIPAMFGNFTARATAIDAWNMFGDLEERFRENLKANIPTYEIAVKVIHDDFRQVDLNEIWSPVDVYFYDGDHGRDCQYQAFTHIAPILSDQFICIVDDVNWEEPRVETLHALSDLGYTLQAQWTLKGPYNGTNSENAWWNSIFVGIVRK